MKEAALRSSKKDLHSAFSEDSCKTWGLDMSSQAAWRIIPILLAVAGGGVAGHLVASAWVSAGILLVLFSVICPFAVCLLTPRRPGWRILVVLLTTLVMDSTIEAEQLIHYSRICRLDLFWEGISEWKWLWLLVVSFGLSLIFSLPLIAATDEGQER